MAASLSSGPRILLCYRTSASRVTGSKILDLPMYFTAAEREPFLPAALRTQHPLNPSDGNTLCRRPSRPQRPCEAPCFDETRHVRGVEGGATCTPCDGNMPCHRENKKFIELTSPRPSKAPKAKPHDEDCSNAAGAGAIPAFLCLPSRRSEANHCACLRASTTTRPRGLSVRRR